MKTSLREKIKKGLTLEELPLVVCALDLKPSVQRALVAYVWMDKPLTDIEDHLGVSKARLHYHMKRIVNKYVGGKRNEQLKRHQAGTAARV